MVSCSPTGTMTPSRGMALTSTSRGAKVRATTGRATSGTQPREVKETKSGFPEANDFHPFAGTGNYLLERRLRGRRRPGETLFAGLEEARKNALEVAQEADAPPQARTEDAAAVSGRLRQRYLATPRDTSWHARGAVHFRPRLHLGGTRDPLRDGGVRSRDRLDERPRYAKLPRRDGPRSFVRGSVGPRPVVFRIRNRPSSGLVGPSSQTSNPCDVPPLCGRCDSHRRHWGARGVDRRGVLPCPRAPGVHRRLHGLARLSAGRLGVAVGGARFDRTVHRLPDRRLPVRWPAVRIRPGGTRFENHPGRSCICTLARTLDHVGCAPSAGRSTRDAKLDIPAALARPRVPWGRSLAW